MYLEKKISVEKYNKEKKVFDQTCENMGQWLEHYQMHDVVPLFNCVRKNFDFFAKLGVDQFRDGSSISGLSLKVGQSLVDTRTNCQAIYLMGEQFSWIQDLLRQNVCGGLAIVLHRLLESGKTVFKDYNGEPGQLCESIEGMDASSQYLGCTAMEMPCGPLQIYHIQNNHDNTVTIKIEKMSPNACTDQNQSEEAMEYIRYLESTFEKNTFQHARSPQGEKLIGNENIAVDAYHIPTKKIYQYHGCHWHAHDCVQPQKDVEDAYSSWLNRRRHSDKIDYYLSIYSNNNLSIIWGCQWKRIKSECESVKQFLKKKYSDFPPLFKFVSSNNEDFCDEISKKIMDGSLFGLLTVDICTPDSLKDYLSIIQPIIKNTNLTLNDVSPVMRQFAIDNNIMTEKSERRNLIGSYFGKHIVLITPLLAWYLKKGLKITKIYNIIQANPHKIFEPFKNAVIEARRNASLDPSLNLVARCFKLLGNSFFGKTATNVYKYKKYKICTKAAAVKSLNNVRFNSMVEYDHNTYEVSLNQRTVSDSLPIIVAYFVYNYAKLNLLQFAYDFIDHYVPRTHYQALATDTDSLYYGIASSTGIETVVRSHLRRDFFENLHKWMPTESCKKHYTKWLRYKLADKKWIQKECCLLAHKADLVTPLLFKLEFRGDRAIALCSKTYFIEGSEGCKMAAKGLRRKSNEVTWNHFYTSLMGKKNITGTNEGIMKKKVSAHTQPTMCTYKKTLNVLNWFYMKRRVADDLVTCLPTNAW